MDKLRSDITVNRLDLIDRDRRVVDQEDQLVQCKREVMSLCLYSKLLSFVIFTLFSLTTWEVVGKALPAEPLCLWEWKRSLAIQLWESKWGGRGPQRARERPDLGAGRAFQELQHPQVLWAPDPEVWARIWREKLVAEGLRETALDHTGGEFKSRSASLSVQDEHIESELGGPWTEGNHWVRYQQTVWEGWARSSDGAAQEKSWCHGW